MTGEILEITSALHSSATILDTPNLPLTSFNSHSALEQKLKLLVVVA